MWWPEMTWGHISTRRSVFTISPRVWLVLWVFMNALNTRNTAGFFKISSTILVGGHPTTKGNQKLWCWVDVNLQENMSNFVVSRVPADTLAPLGAWTSAGTVTLVPDICGHSNDEVRALYVYRTGTQRVKHDDAIKWKHFPSYWPFVRGINRSPVNSPHRPVKFIWIVEEPKDWMLSTITDQYWSITPETHARLGWLIQSRQSSVIQEIDVWKNR